MNVFTIALPAGRLARESINFLESCDVARFEFPASDRALTFFDVDRQFRVLMARSQDVPVYVSQGGADIGIAGRDVLAERGYDLTVPLELNFGRCRLSVAAESGRAETVLRRAHLKVATKYPRLAMDYFFGKGISCEIVKLHGSIEVAPLLGLADCIVDLVSTGHTLQANGLVEVDVILESSALLVANRSVYALHMERMNYIISRIRRKLEG